MSNIVWSAERGWHDGEEVGVKAITADSRCPECGGPVTVYGRIAAGYLTCRRNGHVVRVEDVL